MSATIIRGLVNGFFSLGEHTQVILSGEISPDFVPKENRGHSWCDQQEEEYQTIFGFNPKRGFFQLNKWGGMKEENLQHRIVDSPIKSEYLYSQNGDLVHEDGDPLFTLQGVEQFIFFVVITEGKPYGKNMEEYEEVRVYKAPDFARFKNELRQTDITRWEQWFVEV